MYWILLACNADKENTTEDTVVETTEDTGEVEDSDTNNTQDTQEDTNVEDTGEVEEPLLHLKSFDLSPWVMVVKEMKPNIKLQTFSKSMRRKDR